MMSREFLTLLKLESFSSLRPSPTKVGDASPTAPKRAVRASINLPKSKTNKRKRIKCLQEKLALVRGGWYAHVTPAASKEI